MRLVVDTDAFYKLGICNLFEPALTLFDAGLADCGRLPALPYMLKKGKLAKKLGPEACEMLLAMVDLMPTAPQMDSEWLGKMAAIPEIDVGEAQLLVAVAESGLLMLSADKRAMRQIARVEGLATALQSKVVCLEAILIGLCTRDGVLSVKSRIAQLVPHDKMVGICFRPDDPMEGLNSYYNAIGSEVGHGVLWKWE